MGATPTLLALQSGHGIHELGADNWAREQTVPTPASG